MTAGGVRRVTGEWLEMPATRAVFQCLAAGGFHVRAVGGTVRNALLGLPISDIDLATDALPADVTRLAHNGGLTVIPTGLAHGTVTVVSGGRPYEVTTLRVDVATDGRHATVAFTSDWHADAARRDFTINALYCDLDGTVFDPLGGVRDLDPVKVKFIGDATDRIREDYLRILRFFRFSATIAEGGRLDPDGLAASIDARDGLKRISGERVATELLKMLVAPHARPVTRVMVESGVFAAACDLPGRWDRFARLADIEDALGARPDPVLRLAALASATKAEAETLALRLRCSSAIRERLGTDLIDVAALDEGAARRYLYRIGSNRYRDAFILSWAQSDLAVDDKRLGEIALIPQRWEAPTLPVRGADILALDVAPGPRLGALLAEVEEAWIASGFTLDRQQLLDIARSLIADH